jgi:hypothetical protein
MIEALAGFDPKMAAGILARMALALSCDVDNPDARSIVPDEDAIRSRIMEELRARFALDDQGDELAAERLYQVLDDEAELLLGLPDLDPAIERLSERAELPSDRYVVELDGNVPRFLGRLELPIQKEEELIRLTIREPHAEQHYGPRVSDDRPSLVSLFARRFEPRYPYRAFILLVLGYRQGMTLKVWSAWRIYPAAIDLRSATTLVEITKCFAESYGHVIRVGTKSSKFILSERMAYVRGKEMNVLELKTLRGASGVTITLSRERKLKYHLHGKNDFLVSMFFKGSDEGFVEVAFAMAIDVKEYRSTLRRFGAASSRRRPRA